VCVSWLSDVAKSEMSNERRRERAREWRGYLPKA